MKPTTVFEAIKTLGHDEDFKPRKFAAGDGMETNYAVGSDDKQMVMARRLEAGLPLFHPEDNQCADETTNRRSADQSHKSLL